jgi:hypothetical protein
MPAANRPVKNHPATISIHRYMRTKPTGNDGRQSTSDTGSQIVHTRILFLLRPGGFRAAFRLSITFHLLRWPSSMIGTNAVNHLSLPCSYYGRAVLIFRWSGRRKSESSGLRNRPERSAT